MINVEIYGDRCIILSTDSLDRLICDYKENDFVAFPSNIPSNTLVLLLRRAVISPKVPSFQAIGLEKLQVFDFSWNFIDTFSNDTVREMTFLLSLDIKGNNVLISAPESLFKHLISLNSLKINEEYLSQEMSSRFSEQTNSLGSLQSFVFDSGNAKFALLIASKYTNLTSLEIKRTKESEFAFSL